MESGKNKEKQYILIYEDDLEILELCKIILKNENLTIIGKSFCDNIMEDVNQVNPNLILMDLWIPKIGGEQATQQLKNNAKTRDIPVILFSANENILEICKKVNANDYLKKPFDIDDLKSTVAKHIK